MIDIRKFDTLGHADHGWLDARHHFSFANYYDESRMGWGALRVWNDDAIAAQAGFPPHPHRERLDLAKAAQGLRVQPRFVEEQELGFGQQGGERIREVVPQLVEPFAFGRHDGNPGGRGEGRRARAGI